MQVVNLFEFRPVQAAYTENHCSNPETYHHPAQLSGAGAI